MLVEEYFLLRLSQPGRILGHYTGKAHQINGLNDQPQGTCTELGVSVNYTFAVG